MRLVLKKHNKTLSKFVRKKMKWQRTNAADLEKSGNNKGKHIIMCSEQKIQMKVID